MFSDLGVGSLVGRRGFIKGGILAMTAFISSSLIAPDAVFAMNSDGAYTTTLKNAHTGDQFSGVYRVGNRYLPEAFERINFVLRDIRADEVFPIDPRAIDIITAVHKYSGSREPYSIISGYRSPKTNAMLRSESKGVAKHSLHMSGQAIDVRLANIESKNIREIAVKLKAGGVGYYPRQGFVHMDSGAFRTW